MSSRDAIVYGVLNKVPSFSKITNNKNKREIKELQIVTRTESQHLLMR
jgi:hypothetical protein